MESKGQDKVRAINGRTTGKNKVTKRSTEVDRATLKKKKQIRSNHFTQEAI